MAIATYVAEVAHWLNTPVPQVLAMYWDEILRWHAEAVHMARRR